MKLVTLKVELRNGLKAIDWLQVGQFTALWRTTHLRLCLRRENLHLIQYPRQLISATGWIPHRKYLHSRNLAWYFPIQLCTMMIQADAHFVAPIDLSCQQFTHTFASVLGWREFGVWTCFNGSLSCISSQSNWVALYLCVKVCTVYSFGFHVQTNSLHSLSFVLGSLALELDCLEGLTADEG